MNDKFCADIHNNLSLKLHSTGLQIQHCCWDRKMININDTDEIWNHPEFVKNRTLNSQGKLPIPNCGQCEYMEQHGDSSRRHGVNRYYMETLGVGESTETPSGPRGLEIKIDYTCNIACVYCGPYNSTQWRLELGTDKKVFPIRLKDPDIIELLDRIDLSNLDNIHFYGGDPLLTNTHEMILKYVDKKVGLSKVYVWYNTNATVTVSQRVLDLWSKCRLIKVYFSVDDIGKRFEFIRYGASWNEATDNMMWFKENSPVNTMFTLQPTLSCLNALYHQELLSWKKNNFDANRLGDFTDITRHNVFRTYELNSMPDELNLLCQQANSQDEWFSNYLKSFAYDAAKHQHTKQLILEQSTRRNLDFASIFPELVPYFL